MFKNVGKKIQTVVSVIFFVQFLFSCFTGLAVGMLVNAFIPSRESSALAVLIGLAVVLIGLFFAWLSQLLLFAYGKITESCEEQCSLLRQMLVVQGGTGAMPTVKICVSCGATLDSDAAFCPDCGTPYQGR